MDQAKIPQIFFNYLPQDRQNPKHYHTPDGSLTFCACRDAIILGDTIDSHEEIASYYLDQLTNALPIHLKLIDSDVHATSYVDSLTQTFTNYTPETPNFHQLMPKILPGTNPTWKLVAFRVFQSSPPTLYYLDLAHHSHIECVDVSPNIDFALLLFESQHTQFLLNYSQPRTRIIKATHGQKDSCLISPKTMNGLWRDIPYIRSE